ncbi:alpha/beta hydrolase family protein [Winogradskyella sp.]|uniref:alpha/beta hydrolase family protein n=1 Tax=Winogradskyella sp. TaxID=1883156 RepID=UPI003BABA2E3
MIQPFKSLALFLFLVSSSASFAFTKAIDSIQLIKPSGPYSVGTVTYEWTDTTRTVKLNEGIIEKRRLIAQIWYPSQNNTNGTLAPYSAVSKDYLEVMTNAFQRAGFNNSISTSHIILISPGRGTERYMYTTIAEELVSHGYTVVAVDMPKIGYTIYGDGYIIKPSITFKPPRGMMAGPYEKVDAFFEKPTKMGFEDLRFVLSKLKELNTDDPDNRFTNKLNLKAIGIFGHSLGGRIAGEFANRTPAVKAYAAMEGIPPRKIRYKGMLDIPVMMLCSSGTWPYAKDNYFSLIDHRKKPVYMVELPRFNHNSVTDNPYIFPDIFKFEIDAVEALKTTREILLGYFNGMLKEDNTKLDALQENESIKLQVYP